MKVECKAMKITILFILLVVVVRGNNSAKGDFQSIVNNGQNVYNIYNPETINFGANFEESSKTEKPDKNGKKSDDGGDSNVDRANTMESD